MKLMLSDRQLATRSAQDGVRPRSAVIGIEADSQALKTVHGEAPKETIGLRERANRTQSYYDIHPAPLPRDDSIKRSSYAAPTAPPPHPIRRTSSKDSQSRRNYRLSAPPTTLYNAAGPSKSDSHASSQKGKTSTIAATHDLSIDTHSIKSTRTYPSTNSSTTNSATSTLRSTSGSSHASVLSDDVIFITSKQRVADGSEVLCPEDADREDISTDSQANPQLNLDNSTIIKKRDNIAKEILDSERRYVESLLLLQNLFLNPLLAAVGTPNEILPKKVIQSIFSELAAIVNVNTVLMKKLEERIESTEWDPADGCVGDIFLDLAPFLKMYSSYVKNFNSALSVVNAQVEKVPAFAQFVAKRNANPQLKGLPLQSYLIVPVQRIPRYKMLLEDLLSKTVPDHRDHPTLKNSLDRIAEVAIFVNETIRDHEMQQVLVGVQRSLRGLTENLVVPGRRLIRRGRVQKICRKTHQIRYLILLSDLLIYASPSMLEDQYVLHRKLDLELCEVVDVPDTQELKHIFQLVSPEKSFAMYADSAKEKQDWINAIDVAVRELRTNKSTLRNELVGDNWYTLEKKKKMHDYSAPVWVPDNAANSCMLCSQEFSIIRRKHHCRACGKIVCYACSSRYFIIPGLDEDKPARACDPCYDRISREGKLQVVQPDRTISEVPPSPMDSAPLPPHARRMARRVRPVSMAPQVWSMLGSTFIEPVTPKTPTTRKRAESESNPAVRLVSASGNSLTLQQQVSSVKGCSLCKDPFSLMKWKYQCSKCGRMVCAGCARKQDEVDVCDPCYHGVDPLDVIVSEDGSGWSASWNDSKHSDDGENAATK